MRSSCTGLAGFAREGHGRASRFRVSVSKGLIYSFFLGERGGWGERGEFGYRVSGRASVGFRALNPKP